MTKLEKLRDELAEKFYEIRDKLFNVNHFDRETIAVESYKAGWDAMDAIANDELAKLKEREARLVECLLGAKWDLELAGKYKSCEAITKALADHKRMMEGEE